MTGWIIAAFAAGFVIGEAGMLAWLSEILWPDDQDHPPQRRG